MAYLGPDDIYLYALRAIERVKRKFPIADAVTFARILVALSFQESCIRKTTAEYACFDTEARPRRADGTLASSAFGLTQVLEGTQRSIEKMMKWPARPYADRSDPQYAMDLGAAYLGYLYNGGAKTPRGDWFKTLVAYHDGHYSKKGAGNAYAKRIYEHLKLFDFAAIARHNAMTIAALEFNNRAEFR